MFQRSAPARSMAIVSKLNKLPSTKGTIPERFAFQVLVNATSSDGGGGDATKLQTGGTSC